MNKNIYYTPYSITQITSLNAAPNDYIFAEDKTITNSYIVGTKIDSSYKVHFVEHVDSSNVNDTVLTRNQFDVLLNDKVITDEFIFEEKGIFNLKFKYNELVSTEYRISVINGGNPYLYIGIVGAVLIVGSIAALLVKKYKN